MLEKSKRKGGKILSFANSMGQSYCQSWAFLTSLASFANSFGPGCWQRWASPEARAQLCQQLRPMLLAKNTVGKAGLLCQQPCRADLPTASTDTVGKTSCWQSCRSLCQPHFANSRRFPVGEGNGIRADGVPSSPTAHMAVGEAFPTGPALLLGKPSPTGLESSPTLLAKHAFPVVTQTHEWVLYLDLIVGVSLTVVKVSSMRSGASGH
jgi:hypothetical protein